MCIENERQQLEAILALLKAKEALYNEANFGFYANGQIGLAIQALQELLDHEGDW